MCVDLFDCSLFIACVTGGFSCRNMCLCVNSDKSYWCPGNYYLVSPNSGCCPFCGFCFYSSVYSHVRGCFPIPDSDSIVYLSFFNLCFKVFRCGGDFCDQELVIPVIGSWWFQWSGIGDDSCNIWFFIACYSFVKREPKYYYLFFVFLHCVDFLTFSIWASLLCSSSADFGLR